MTRSDQLRAAAFAAAGLVLVAVVIVVLAVTGGDDDADDAQLAAVNRCDGLLGDTTIELFINDEVTAVAGADALVQAIDAALREAAGEPAGGSVLLVSDSFGARFETALTALDEHRRYTEAFERLGAVREQAVSEADLYSKQEEARTALDAAEAALIQRVERELVVELASGRLDFEIVPVTVYGAARRGAERWALVRAGVAMVLYEDDLETMRQSIANAVVQGLGLLGGLEHRDGKPVEAMAADLEIDADEHLARDAGAVTFTPAECERLRASLGGAG